MLIIEFNVRFLYLSIRLVQTAIRANSYADEIKNLEQAILEKENANVVSFAVGFVV